MIEFLYFYKLQKWQKKLKKSLQNSQRERVIEIIKNWKLWLLSSLSWKWWDKESEMDILDYVYNEDAFYEDYEEKITNYEKENPDKIGNIEFTKKEIEQLEWSIAIIWWKIDTLKNNLKNEKNKENIEKITNEIKRHYYNILSIKHTIKTWNHISEFNSNNDLSKKEFMANVDYFAE